jgi:hypothetical protein
VIGETFLQLSLQMQQFDLRRNIDVSSFADRTSSSVAALGDGGIDLDQIDSDPEYARKFRSQSRQRAKIALVRDGKRERAKENTKSDLVPVGFFGNGEYAWTNSLRQIIEVRSSTDRLLSHCLGVIGIRTAGIDLDQNEPRS